MSTSTLMAYTKLLALVTLPHDVCLCSFPLTNIVPEKLATTVKPSDPLILSALNFLSRAL